MLGDPELIARRDPDRAPRLKWATYTSTRFISGAAMGFAAQAAIAAISSEFGELVAASLVGAIVGEILDGFFSALTASVRGRPIRDAIEAMVPLVSHIGPCLHAASLRFSRTCTCAVAMDARLFLIPALAAQRLYGLYQEQRQLAVDLSEANDTLERANLQFAAALIATLDARDRYTAGHSAAVAIYSRDIASEWACRPRYATKRICVVSFTTSGRSGCRRGSSRSPAPSPSTSAAKCRSTPAIGERILAHVDEYSEIATIVRHHHERIDGKGYPDGLEDDVNPAGLTHHRRCGRIQRDDIGQAVP